jgi:serine phosphatase RsbU (regulator of sigma subunit)
MLGISLIKEVITQNKELMANEVLDELRESLMKALHQTGRDDEAKDGMDIALCVIDHSKMQLEYSGANNSCYIIRNEQLIELKADRMPIGIHPVIKPFTSKPIQLEKDDVIYLSSDGFRDQIGGESNKKFKVAKFHEMLIEMHSQPMDIQPEILDKKHTEWRGDMEQTDDILIVGVKV